MVVQEQPKPTAQTMQPTQPQPNPNALSKEEREKEEKKSWSCLFFKQVEVMLPAPLLSTYQRYKQDTDIVASWLATTAKSCGYPTDLLSEVAARSAPSADPATGDTPRQPKAKDKGKTNGKGKKKKPAKKNDAAPAVPKRYTVAVKEFVPLAEFISTKKQAKVPDAFVSALNRVIALRAQFSAKLSEHGAKRNVVSDLKHNYFLGILDKVREVLRPRMTADGARASNEGLDHLSNRFAGLSVFEPSQAFLDAPDIEIPRPDPNVIYEAEAGDSTEDAIFFFQLLWRDLYDIRMCIRVLWRKYMEGYGINEVDLVAVAIATNTALDLARHMINDVFSEFEGREEVFYKTLKEQAILTHYREQANPENSYFGLTKNPDAAELKHNAGSWSFVNAYNMLAEILPALSTEGEPIGPILPRNEADEPGMENSWYAAHHGHLKAMLEDLLVVMKSVKDWPVEDNLLRGFKEALETRKIPFHFVFSAQLHLDIIWRFGLDVGSTHLIDQFLNKMRAMKDLVQDYIAINTELGTLESMGPYDMNARQVGKDSQRMLDDPIFEARLQEVPKKSRAQAKAKLEKHRLLKRNPVLCGLITYRHMMLLYKDGIALANATRSIVAAYHLYNAVTRERMLPKNWEDMNCVNCFIDQQDLVAGTVAVYNPGYTRSILITMGLSVYNFADAHRTRPKRARLLQQTPRRIIRETCPTSAAFFDRYVTHRGQTGSDNWIAADIFRIVVEGSKVDETKPEIVKQIRDEGLYLKPENIATMVGTLSQLINDEKLKLAPPMIMLHAQSFRVMKYVRDLCEPMIARHLGPPDRLLTDLDIPLIAPWILQTYSAVTAGKGIMEQAAGVFEQVILKDDKGKRTILEYLEKMGWKIPTPAELQQEAQDEEPAGPPDPMRVPMSIGRAQEALGMPLDTSRLENGMYIDTSGLRGDAVRNFRREDSTTIIGADGDDPFEVTETTLSW